MQWINWQESVLFEAYRAPITTFIFLLLCYICYRLNEKSCGYEVVGLSYERVVQYKEYWRCCTSAFSHLSILHVLFNASTLWSLGFLEYPSVLGATGYLSMTFFLIVFSNIIYLSCCYVLIHKFGKERHRTVYCIGYSCVVFGLMTMASQLNPTAQMSFLGFVSLPNYLAPFAALIFTQILVPNASFLGHLSGIVAAYVLWYGRATEWLSLYWLIQIAIWCLIFMAYSLSKTSNWMASFIQVEDDSQGARMVNGVLMPAQSAASAEAENEFV